jgi:hypothetical protein
VPGRAIRSLPSCVGHRFVSNVQGRIDYAGGIGNHGLVALMFKNYDATIEREFSKTASDAVFYRDMSGALQHARSRFLNGNSVNANGIYIGEGTEAIRRLDFSFAYTPVKQITLVFDVTNILAQPFRNYAQYGNDRDYPRDVRDEGRYFGAGARFRF